MERSNHHTRSQRSNFEQAVGRMRCVWGGIVSEANAQSNVWDRQTETRLFGG
ncbi:hypothetical protein [Pedobacter hiemivivus]|uniref:hypothetical protein n=1 Tax=Pedobacter hiemivivus TaxID=2530454 RepID=UPI00197E81CF|nr:hypothetical protein [Pedobacter hiemivivus]